MDILITKSPLPPSLSAVISTLPTPWQPKPHPPTHSKSRVSFSASLQQPLLNLEQHWSRILPPTSNLSSLSREKGQRVFPSSHVEELVAPLEPGMQQDPCVLQQVTAKTFKLLGQHVSPHWPTIGLKQVLPGRDDRMESEWVWLTGVKSE